VLGPDIDLGREPVQQHPPNDAQLERARVVPGLRHTVRADVDISCGTTHKTEIPK